EFVRRRTTCMCGVLSEPIDATDRMQGPVDIDPQLSADLRAERLEFMQNAARERPKPRQCRKQFTDRARARGRDSIFAIAIKRHGLVAIADVCERTHHE